MSKAAGDKPAGNPILDHPWPDPTGSGFFLPAGGRAHSRPTEQRHA